MATINDFQWVIGVDGQGVTIKQAAYHAAVERSDCHHRFVRAARSICADTIPFRAVAGPPGASVGPLCPLCLQRIREANERRGLV